jgi:hypothetical protein
MQVGWYVTGATYLAYEFSVKRIFVGSMYTVQATARNFPSRLCTPGKNLLARPPIAKILLLTT